MGTCVQHSHGRSCDAAVYTTIIRVCCLPLAGVCPAVTTAQPTCRVYKTFRTTANSTTLLDTIRVADDFPVASATVSRISASPSADNLQLFLLHGAAADSPGSLPTPVALRAGSAGTLVPETAISAAALGEWTLMLRDTQTDVRCAAAAVTAVPIETGQCWPVHPTHMLRLAHTTGKASQIH